MRVFLGLQEQSERVTLLSMVGHGEPLDLVFERPLSAGRLADLELYRNSQARLVFLANSYFSREECLATVPVEWRARTWEEELPLSPGGSPQMAQKFAYQFQGYENFTKAKQLILVSYTFLSVLRVAFWSVLTTAIGPRLKYLRPLKKVYWFVKFQFAKRTTSWK